MSYRRIFAALLVGFIFGFMGHKPLIHAASAGDVVISEVAWMGTQASANDEWIELYNNTDSDIDLTGWKLQAEDGTPTIVLSGIIPAHGFFLLERTDDNTVSDIAADLVYGNDGSSWALSNSGEKLFLKDPLGNVIDSANGNGGAWPAGTASPRATMERIDPTAPDSDANWDTNDGVHRNGLDANNNPINGTPKAPRQRASFNVRDVVISEVAWMGTEADANDEWIELYNNTDHAISLVWWRLEAADGIPSIVLSGTIPARGFFLLERTDDNTVSDIPADQIYTGALSNSGEALFLKDPSGNIIDTANGAGGPWPAGIDFPRATMERLDLLAPDSDTNWATNNGIYRNGLDADGNPINGTPKAHKPPYVTITSPTHVAPVYIYPGESFTVSFTSDEVGTSEIQVNGISCGGGAVSVGTNSQICTLSGSLAHGVYDLSVTVTDVTMAAGAALATDAVHVIIATLGDVNGDGKINVIDARLAQQHADGFITLPGMQFLAADVDQDSDVDSDDATAIAKKGIGLPTGIPWFALAMPMLVFLLVRSRRKITLLLFIVGLMGTLTSCTEFAGLPPPSGPAVFITSTSMPSGATRTLDIVVQNVITEDGVASLQGRITYPRRVTVQSLTGLNGFIVKALAIDNTVGELRFALIKPSPGGINSGAVARVTLSVSGAPGEIVTLRWAASAQTPIVIGGDTNTEITGLGLGDGQVKVR